MCIMRPNARLLILILLKEFSKSSTRCREISMIYTIRACLLSLYLYIHLLSISVLVSIGVNSMRDRAMQLEQMKETWRHAGSSARPGFLENGLCPTAGDGPFLNEGRALNCYYHPQTFNR